MRIQQYFFFSLTERKYMKFFALLTMIVFSIHTDCLASTSSDNPTASDATDVPNGGVHDVCEPNNAVSSLPGYEDGSDAELYAALSDSDENLYAGFLDGFEEINRCRDINEILLQLEGRFLDSLAPQGAEHTDHYE